MIMLELEIIERFNPGPQTLEILAENSEGTVIGGLYLNQAYDESESLDYIPDEDSESECPEPIPYINLQLLEVEPEYRMQGIARKLMDYFFENQLFELFVESNTYIQLDVHPQGLGITSEILKRFYKQYGFESTYSNYMIRNL